MRFAIALMIALSELLLVPSLRADPGFEKAFYLQREASIRKEYDQMIAELNKAARERGTTNSPLMPIAVSGIKSMLYNKAYIDVACSAHALETKGSSSSEVMWAEIENCGKRKREAMVKVMKLGEYLTTIGEAKVKQCEMQSRLFVREVEFPAYSFLLDESSKLYDFEKFAFCLLGDR